MYDSSGINFRTAAQWDKGVVLRVKRLIRSGGDHAREVVTGVPGVSNVANWFTLGLFKKALKPKGAQVRTTWLAIDCEDKTFDVTNDSTGWKNILDDATGQAEDIYFSYCSPDTSGAKAYLSLPKATEEVLKAAGELTKAKTAPQQREGKSDPEPDRLGDILKSSPIFNDDNFSDSTPQTELPGATETNDEDRKEERLSPGHSDSNPSSNLPTDKIGGSGKSQTKVLKKSESSSLIQSLESTNYQISLRLYRRALDSASSNLST